MSSYSITLTRFLGLESHIYHCFFVCEQRRRAVVHKNDSWELETPCKTQDLMGSVKRYGHEIINIEVLSIVNVETHCWHIWASFALYHVRPVSSQAFLIASRFSNSTTMSTLLGKLLQNCYQAVLGWKIVTKFLFRPH